MSDEKKKLLPDGSEPREKRENGGSTAMLEPKQKGQTKPKPRPPGLLPMYRVLLHNDDKNTIEHVIVTIVELIALKAEEAVERAVEAHKTGVSLLIVTHKERAELYVDQFQSKSLIVTIEPVD